MDVGHQKMKSNTHKEENNLTQDLNIKYPLLSEDEISKVSYQIQNILTNSRIMDKNVIKHNRKIMLPTNKDKNNNHIQV